MPLELPNFDPLKATPTFSRSLGSVLESDEPGTFENLFTFLGRPFYATGSLLTDDLEGAARNVFQGLLDLPTGGFLDRDLSLANLFNPESPIGVLAGTELGGLVDPIYARGGDLTTRKQRPEGSELLYRWGAVDEAPEFMGTWERLGYDLALGIVVDPLTYLSGAGAGRALAAKFLAKSSSFKVGENLIGALRARKAGTDALLHGSELFDTRGMKGMAGDWIKKLDRRADQLEKGMFGKAAGEAGDPKNSFQRALATQIREGLEYQQLEAISNGVFDAVHPETFRKLERMAAHDLLYEGLRKRQPGTTRIAGDAWKAADIDQIEPGLKELAEQGLITTEGHMYGRIPLLMSEPGKIPFADNFWGGKVYKWGTMPGWVENILGHSDTTKPLAIAMKNGRERLGDWLGRNPLSPFRSWAESDAGEGLVQEHEQASRIMAHKNREAIRRLQEIFQGVDKEQSSIMGGLMSKAQDESRDLFLKGRPELHTQLSERIARLEEYERRASALFREGVDPLKKSHVDFMETLADEVAGDNDALEILKDAAFQQRKIYGALKYQTDTGLMTKLGSVDGAARVQGGTTGAQTPLARFLARAGVGDPLPGSPGAPHPIHSPNPDDIAQWLAEDDDFIRAKTRLGEATETYEGLRAAQPGQQTLWGDVVPEEAQTPFPMRRPVPYKKPEMVVPDAPVRPEGDLSTAAEKAFAKSQKKHAKKVEKIKAAYKKKLDKYKTARAKKVAAEKKRYAKAKKDYDIAAAKGKAAPRDAARMSRAKERMDKAQAKYDSVRTARESEAVGDLKATFARETTEAAKDARRQAAVQASRYEADGVIAALKDEAKARLKAHTRAWKKGVRGAGGKRTGGVEEAIRKRTIDRAVRRMGGKLSEAKVRQVMNFMFDEFERIADELVEAGVWKDADRAGAYLPLQVTDLYSALLSGAIKDPKLRKVLQSPAVRDVFTKARATGLTKKGNTIVDPALGDQFVNRLGEIFGRQVRKDGDFFAKIEDMLQIEDVGEFRQALSENPNRILQEVLSEIAANHNVDVKGLANYAMETDLAKLYYRRVLAHNRTIARKKVWEHAKKAGMVGERGSPNKLLTNYLNYIWRPMGDRQSMVTRFLGGGRFTVPVGRSSGLKSWVEQRTSKASARHKEAVTQWRAANAAAIEKRAGLTRQFGDFGPNRLPMGPERDRLGAEAVLSGKKPFSTLSEDELEAVTSSSRKVRIALEEGRLELTDGPGFSVLHQPGADPSELIRDFEELQSYRGNQDAWPADLHARIGEKLGYSEDDVRAFLEQKGHSSDEIRNALHPEELVPLPPRPKLDSAVPLWADSVRLERGKDGAEQVVIDWKGVNQFWKPLLTSFPTNPGFHVRNTIGALFMNLFDPELGNTRGEKIQAIGNIFRTLYDGFAVRMLGRSPSKTAAIGRNGSEIADVMVMLHASGPESVALRRNALERLGKAKGGIGRYSWREAYEAIEGFRGPRWRAGADVATNADELARRVTESEILGRYLSEPNFAQRMKDREFAQGFTGAFNKWVETGADMAEWIEDRWRVTSFLNLLDKNVPIDAAIKRIETAFVDYNVYDSTERALRDIFPFIAFASGSVKWAKNLANRPVGVNWAGRMQGSMAAEGNDETPLPQQAKDSLALPLPWKDLEGNTQFLTSLGLPFETTVNMLSLATPQPEQWRRHGLGMAHPLLKLPMEMVAGKNFYFGSDWGEYRRAPDWLRAAGLAQEIDLGDGRKRYEIRGDVNEIIRSMPTSRIQSTVGRFFDQRKGKWNALLQTFTGARIMSVDEEKELKKGIERMLKDKADAGQAGEVLKWFMRLSEEETPEEVKILLHGMKQVDSRARKRRKEYKERTQRVFGGFAQ